MQGQMQNLECFHLKIIKVQSPWQANKGTPGHLALTFCKGAVASLSPHHLEISSSNFRKDTFEKNQKLLVVLCDIIVGSCLVVKTCSYKGLYGGQVTKAKVAVSLRTCTNVFSPDEGIMLALITG